MPRNFRRNLVRCRELQFVLAKLNVAATLEWLDINFCGEVGRLGHSRGSL